MSATTQGDGLRIWQSPRLVAAAACFLLGVAVIGAGLAPRLMGPATAASEVSAEFDDFGESEAELAPEAVAESAASELVVYVSGAVVAPDVYRLPAGSRLKDAVVAAGGLRDDAAAEQVNLAEPVSDAQHVHIPALVADSVVAAGPVGAEDDGRLDLNRASEVDLEELPGVGKVLAERIVAYRDEHGPFASVEALREVAGVGAKLFEQLSPLVKVEG